jgi:hypothetical protein
MNLFVIKESAKHFHGLLSSWPKDAPPPSDEDIDAQLDEIIRNCPDCKEATVEYR